MLLSTSLAYLPAYAITTAVVYDYTIVEGEQIADDIKTAEEGTDILLMGQVGLDYYPESTEVLAWVADDPLDPLSPGHWEMVLKTIDIANQYARFAVPMTGTANLPEGEYEVMVINDAAGVLTVKNTVSLKVNANSRPVGSNFSIPYDEVAVSTQRMIDLTPYVTDVDGHVPGIESVISSNLDAGIVSPSGLMIYYDQAKGFDGTFTIKYVLKDGFEYNLLSDEYTITVTVDDTIPTVNNPPVAVDDAVTTNIGEDVDIYPLKNDMDVEEDNNLKLSEIVILTDVDGDDYELIPGNDFFTYKPNDEFRSTVLIQYTATDSGGLSDTGIVSVHLNDPTVDHPVYVQDDFFSMRENNDSSPDTKLILVTENDSFEDGYGHIKIDVADSRLHAMEDDSAMGITVSPDSNILGTFDISYTLFDADIENPDQASGTLVLEITEYVDDMHLYHDEFFVREGEKKLFNVIDNDKIAKNEKIKSVELLSQAKWGTAIVAVDGSTSYTAHETYDGPRDDDRVDDTFWYQVTLESGQIDTEYVDIILIEVDYIKIQNDRIRINEDAQWTKIDVLENDIIPEELLSFFRDNDVKPLHGDIRFVVNKINGTNKIDKENSYIEYRPHEGFIGEDSFGYKVRDDDGTRAEAMVVVEVLEIPRLDYEFDGMLYMNTPKHVQGSVDVSTLIYPSYFDTDTLLVTDVAFNDSEDLGQGAPAALGTLAKYTPSSDRNVELVFTVVDTYGHVAKGMIKVTVTDGTSTNYVVAHELDLIRVNQYSDPDMLRTGVEYHVANGMLPSSKFESPEYRPDLYPQGFYHFDASGKPNMFMPNGDAISVTYYFGEFALKYGMKVGDDRIYAVAPPLRPVSVNGKPLIDLDNPVDPTDIDFDFTPISVTTATGPMIDEVVDYHSFDILTRLYGYDFEDYYHGGLNPTKTLAEQMPYLYDDETVDKSGKVRVQFRLYDGENYFVYDIDEFWTRVVVGNIEDNMIPEGSLMSGEEDEIDYTVYDIQFMMIDSEDFESDWTEPWHLKVENEAPKIIEEPVEPDWFRVIKTGDPINFVSWFEIEDDEDYTYARSPYNFINPDFDLNVNQWSMNIYHDDLGLVWQTGDENPFDTQIPGVYEVEFMYTDLHGLTVDETVELWIVPESYVEVDMNDLDMETNGYFPTFMGVFAEFWHPYSNMGPRSVELSEYDYEDMYYNGYMKEYVMAMIDGVEVARAYANDYYGPRMMTESYENWGELIQLEENGTTEITYHAVQEIYDDGQWFPVISNIEMPDQAVEVQAGMEETNNLRIIHVTDADFDDYFLSSDIGDYMSSEQVYLKEMDDMILPPPMYFGSVFYGEQYPLLTKNKVVTIEVEKETQDGVIMVDEEVIESRIVTTVAEIFTPQTSEPVPSSVGMFEDGRDFKTFILLDIAETFNGDVFGISLEEMWVEEEPEPVQSQGPQGHMEMVQKLWKLIETGEQAGSFREIESINEVIENNDLINEIKAQFTADPEDINVEMMPVASLTADKDGNLVFVVSARVSRANGVEYDYNAIVVVNQDGMVLSIDLTDTEEGFGLVSDIAYDETMEHLYALVSENPNGYLFDPSAVSTQGLMGDQALIEFVMIVPEDDEVVMPQGLLDNIGIGTYTTEMMMPLDRYYHYTGLAMLNNELVLIKVGEEPEMDDPFYMDTADRRYGIYTFAEFINFEEEVYATNSMNTMSLMLPEPFTWGLGAAASYDRTLSLIPSSYNVTAGTTVNLVFTGKPESVYGVGIWSHDGTGTLSDVDASTYGIETASYATVAGALGTSTNVTFTVNTNEGPVKAVVRVTTPGPIAPTPDPTPAQVVGVTLDTDAITLDYGQSADPEFTSYDFTETVTGTTDTRVTWSLDDDTFATVDENGLVTARDNVPVDTGDITVILTVTTVVGNATATATIIFEEQTPLGAIEFFEPYVTGYPDGSFAPDKFVSRAEVASMFARFLNLNTTYPGEKKFNDVDKTHWAYAYIQGMYRTGIFTGYVNDKGERYFDPEAPIKRSEIAQVFSNYWNYLDISVSGEGTTMIPDVASTYWAYGPINRVFNTGLFDGFEDGTFRPENPTLRVQLVAMINKLLNRPQLEAETSSFNDVDITHPFFGDIEAASQTFLKPQGE